MSRITWNLSFYLPRTYSNILIPATYRAFLHSIILHPYLSSILSLFSRAAQVQDAVYGLSLVGRGIDEADLAAATAALEAPTFSDGQAAITKVGQIGCRRQKFLSVNSACAWPLATHFCEPCLHRWPVSRQLLTGRPVILGSTTNGRKSHFCPLVRLLPCRARCAHCPVQSPGFIVCVPIVCSCHPACPSVLYLPSAEQHS